MLGSFNNWNIIQFTDKTTSSEDFDAVHKVVLDCISYNMASLAQFGRCGAINAADPTTMEYYVIKYLSEPYILKEDQTTGSKLSEEGEPVVKDEYLSIMKSKTNWHW